MGQDKRQRVTILSSCCVSFKLASWLAWPVVCCQCERAALVCLLKYCFFCCCCSGTSILSICPPDFNSLRLPSSLRMVVVWMRRERQKYASTFSCFCFFFFFVVLWKISSFPKTKVLLLADNCQFVALAYHQFASSSSDLHYLSSAILLMIQTTTTTTNDTSTQTHLCSCHLLAPLLLPLARLSCAPSLVRLLQLMQLAGRRSARSSHNTSWPWTGGRHQCSAYARRNSTGLANCSWRAQWRRLELASNCNYKCVGSVCFRFWRRCNC